MTPYDASLTGAGWNIQPIPVPVPDILSDAMPAAEATMATPGAANRAPRVDHQHPRLTSSTRVALDANGLATVNYTRTFATKPAIILTAINPSGRAVQLEVVTDVMTGALYTGCTIKGYRSQLLPSLGGIVLIGPLLTALGNFDVLGGSAAGVEISVIAIQPSN